MRDIATLGMLIVLGLANVYSYQMGGKAERLAARLDNACSFASWTGGEDVKIAEKVAISYDHQAAFVQVGDAKVRITAESGGRLRADYQKPEVKQ